MAGRRARACLPLALTFAALLAQPASPSFAQDADSVEGLYRAGVKARTARDFERAATLLEKALRRDRRNADVLTQLGLVYTAQQKYGDARRVLELAVRIAPRYVDARLALGRVLAWQGDLAGAQTQVDRALKLEPANREGRLFDARLAMMRRDYAAAERKFAALAVAHPRDAEILLGLGDAQAELGRTELARRTYRAVLDIDPHNETAPRRLAAPAGAAPDVRETQWELSQSYSVSAFSRQRREPWHESFTQLTYRPDPAAALHARAEVSRRFHETDTFLEAGVDYRFSQAVGSYLYLGGTPNAHFREEINVLAGGLVRVSRNGDAVGPTLLSLDGRYARYVTGPVRTVAPGLQQYFAQGRLWISAKWINTWASDGKHQNGWFVRGDVLISDRLRAYAGLADAPETSDNITADTRSYFGGLAYDANRRLGFRVDYLHEDRKNSYLRNAVTATIVYRF